MGMIMIQKEIINGIFKLPNRIQNVFVWTHMKRIGYLQAGQF
jgi:hypothetical protein